MPVLPLHFEHKFERDVKQIFRRILYRCVEEKKTHLFQKFRTWSLPFVLCLTACKGRLDRNTIRSFFMLIYGPVAQQYQNLVEACDKMCLRVSACESSFYIIMRKFTHICGTRSSALRMQNVK